ncbi:MAG: alpha/beta hydrolase [Phycisphaerales bacterium]|nr:alpha/beta hydrolase [Phycisphaerales bacterium]
MPHAHAADGTKLYYKDWGTGPAVVLVHGWPLSADMWEAQAPALVEARFRVVAYDRRGFGRSDQPWSGYDYNTFTDDLKAVVDACGLTSFALVGFSMGGGEVARYMTRHGGRGVTKAALLGSIVPLLGKSADNPVGVPREALDGIIKGLREDRAAFLESFFPNFYGHTLLSHPVSAAALAWHRSIALQASPKATTACDDARAFKVPTLIIHGDADAIVPIDTSARAAKKLIPGAKYIEYAGAPHGFCTTHAERTTPDLLAFLKS